MVGLVVGLVGCRQNTTQRKDDPTQRTPMCGDGIIDPGEDCDGSDLAMATCQSLGFDTGSLSCGTECRFATSLCTKRCGNGAIDVAETCDGTLVSFCPIGHFLRARLLFVVVVAAPASWRSLAALISLRH